MGVTDKGLHSASSHQLSIDWLVQSSWFVSSTPPSLLFCTVIYRGGVAGSCLCLLFSNFFFCPLQTAQKPLTQQKKRNNSTSLPHRLTKSTSIPPTLRLQLFPSPLAGCASPPLAPRGSAQSKTEGHVTRAGSIRVHLFRSALYNESYITCLLIALPQPAILAGTAA